MWNGSGTIGLGVLAAAILAGGTASATIFQKDYHESGVLHAYDDVNQTYSMRFNTGGNDGFWLVVSDGPNPKSHMQEYAILYGDLEADRITAYVYDGVNSANSYRSTDYLGSYENVFKDLGGGAVQFDLDVALINAAYDDAGWDGVQMGADSGIWFHRSSGSNFAYAEDGALLNYNFSGEMWVDTGFDATVTANSPDCSSGALAQSFANPCGATEPGLGPVASSGDPAGAGASSGGGGAGASSGGGAGASSGGGAIAAPGGLALLLAGVAGFGLRRRAQR